MMEMDVRDLMIDGCICPCGCGERTPMGDCLDAHDELARRRLIADGVADAILELEAWADWWMGPTRDFPFPPGFSLNPPSSLSALALSAFNSACPRFRRFGADEATAESFFSEYGHPKICALPFLEAAALLRDGWRP